MLHNLQGIKKQIFEVSYTQQIAEIYYVEASSREEALAIMENHHDVHPAVEHDPFRDKCVDSFYQVEGLKE